MFFEFVFSIADFYKEIAETNKNMAKTQQQTLEPPHINNGKVSSRESIYVFTL